MILGIGDTIITYDNSAYLIIDAYGFNLCDGENRANYILVNVKQGKMEGYFEDLNEIQESYRIINVLKIY